MTVSWGNDGAGAPNVNLPARQPAGGKWLPWLLALSAAAYTAWFWSDPIGDGRWFSPFGGDMLHSDSDPYITFKAPRTAGYPVFLDLAEAVFGTWRAAPRVQLVLLAGAVFFLGSAVFRAFRAPWLALSLALAVFGLNAVARFHAYILSEALFAPLLYATTGCLALFVARPTARLAAVAALLCGLAVAVRPAGLLLLAIWPILLWLLGRRCAGRRWRLAAAVAVPLALCALAEYAAWHRAHGDLPGRPNVADRHFFAKALMMDAEPAVRDPEVADVLSDAWRATAAFRKAVADAPDWQSRTILLMRAEQDAGRGKHTRPFRHRLSELARPTGRHRSYSAAREVVFARPREWMANAAVHYVGLWAHYTIHDEAFSRRWAAWTEGLDDEVLRSSRIAEPLPWGPFPRWVTLPHRLATVASFLASLIVLGLAARQRLGKGRVDDDLVVGAVAALTVHACYVMAAVFNTVELRYAAAMWPFQAVYGLVLVRWMLNTWTACAGSAGQARRFRGRSRPPTPGRSRRGLAENRLQPGGTGRRGAMSKRRGRSRRSRGAHGDSQHTTGRSTLMMATVLLLLHADALPSPLAFDNPFHKSIEPADGAVTVGIVGFASLPIVDGYPAQMMKMADVPGAGRLFVNDMGGVLYSVSYDGGTVTPWLDLGDPRWALSPIPRSAMYARTRGFQSFAFHPQFVEPDAPGFGRLYTFADTADTKPRADFVSGSGKHTHDTVLLEWKAQDPRAAFYDGGPPRELMRIEQPHVYHNGGQIAFHPHALPGDAEFGLLYMGVADGGNEKFLHWTRPQDPGKVFGKILRIDPLGTNSANGRYGIPADNPFIADARALGEIYAYGLRNPQNLSWDMHTGRLFTADIGRDRIEEVNVIVPGANFGWDDWEGSVRTDRLVGSLRNLRAAAAVTWAVVEYDHVDPLLLGEWVAVTGPIVYRHDAIPPLTGRVLFGDLPSGEVFYFDADNLPDGGPDAIRRVLFSHDGEVKSFLRIIEEKLTAQDRTSTGRADLRFGTGPDGQLFLLNKHDGTIRRVVAMQPPPRSH